RRIRRSSAKPRPATASPLSSAATQRFGTKRRIDTPRYAPIMNSDPCVRLAMRMRPKISENPAASRNSRPPSARLFSVWTIQNCMLEAAGSGLEVLRGRPVARVHRILQEFLRIVGPELAHVRVRVDNRVDEAPLLALDLPDVDIPDDVAVFVEGDRAADGVR